MSELSGQILTMEQKETTDLDLQQMQFKDMFLVEIKRQSRDINQTARSKIKITLFLSELKANLRRLYYRKSAKEHSQSVMFSSFAFSPWSRIQKG